MKNNRTNWLGEELPEFSPELLVLDLHLVESLLETKHLERIDESVFLDFFLEIELGIEVYALDDSEPLFAEV